MEKNINSENQNNNLLVIGLGNSGNDIINSIPKNKFLNTNFVCLNTINSQKEDFELDNLVENDWHESLFNSLYIDINENKINNSIEQFKEILKDVKVLIIATGLGGNVGTNVAPMIAKIAKEMKILTIAIVTMPFSFEGPNKRKNAFEGLKELKDNVDSISVISNNKLLNNFPDIALKDAFQLTNNIFRNFIKTFSILMNNKSVINLDFYNLKEILNNNSDIYFGFGSGVGRNKIKRAIQSSLNSKVMKTKLEDVNNVILSIVADPNVSNQQVKEMVINIKEKFRNDIDIAFDFSIDNKLREEIIISIIATSKRIDDEFNVDIDDTKKTQEFLIKIGNTLELEISGQQPIESTEIDLDDINENDDEINSKKSIISYDETDEIDIPSFLK